MEPDTKKVFFHTSLSALGRFLGVGTALLTTALVTRALGSARFGDYALVMAFLSVFYILADFGLGQLLVRELSRGPRAAGVISRGPRAELDTADIVTLRLVLAIVFLSLAPLVALVFPYTGPVRRGLVVAAAGFLFLSLSQLLVGIFQKAMRMQWVAVAEWAGRLVQLGGAAAVFGALWRGWLDPRAATVLDLFLLSFVWGALGQLAFLFFKGRTLLSLRLRWHLKGLGAALKRALPLGASLLFVYVYFRTDTIILSLYHPGSPVGFYNLAYKVLENLIFFPAAYVGLVLPRLTEAWPRDQARFQKVFSTTLFPLATAAPLVAVGSALGAPLLMRVLGGAGFEPAAGALVILSIAIFFIYLATLPGQAIVAMNAEKKALWVYLAGAVLNVAANLAFIPRYSYIAAAWTTVGTEALVTAGLYWLVWREVAKRRPEPSQQ